MKNLLITLLVAMILSLTVSAQECQALDNAALIKMFESYVAKYGQAGEEHKAMAAWEGNWASVGKDCLTGMEMKAVFSNKMILGGKFLMEEMKSEDGQLVGIGFLGYDNVYKKYVSIWFDSMDTTVIPMLGVWDEAAKEVVFTADETCPETGKKMTFKNVWKMVDANTNISIFYLIIDGQEVKLMEATNTLVK
jgi:hypothetical protein